MENDDMNLVLPPTSCQDYSYDRSVVIMSNIIYVIRDWLEWSEKRIE